MATKARKRGRPTKLTDELQRKIVRDVRRGAFIDTACQAAGIDEQTYRNWMRWGREGKDGKTAPRYRDFFDAVTRARAEAELKLLAKATAGDGQATSNGPAKCAQWALEHTRPTRYATRVNVKIEEAITAALDDVERVCAGKDCGCYEAILEAIARRARGEEAGSDPVLEAPEPDAPAVH